MDERTSLKSMHDVEKTTQSEEIETDPCQSYCASCNRTVTTYVKTELNFYIIFIIILSLYFYGFFYSIFILAITIPLCKNVTHSCPNCLLLLHERQFYPIKKKDKYLMLQYGKCVLLVNSIWIISLIVLIVLFGIYLNVMDYMTPKVIQEDDRHTTETTNKFISNLYSKNASAQLTWDEFITECGASVMVENSARAIEIFNRKYYKRTVDWKGYFLNAFVQNIRPFEVHSDHLVNLNIRMIPSETLKSQDLVLSMDEKKYKHFHNILHTFKTGTPIVFTGTLESLGDEWKPHHMHLKTIDVTEDFIPSETKVVLFKGINFDISGHLKVQREVIKAKEIEESNQQLLNQNITQSTSHNDNEENNDKSSETKEEISFELEEEKSKKIEETKVIEENKSESDTLKIIEDTSDQGKTNDESN